VSELYHIMHEVTGFFDTELCLPVAL